MKDYGQVLLAYQSLNPAGWVNAYRVIPLWAGIVLVVVGATLLVFGGGRAFRFVAGPMGALVGFLWGPIVTQHMGVEVSATAVSIAIAALFAVIGFAFPPGAVFFAIGLPAGLLCGQMAGDADWFLGFVPATLLVGTIGAIMNRYVASVTAALIGGWLMMIGLLASLHFIHGLVAAAEARPWGVILVAGLFAASGSVYQLAVLLPPEEAEKLRLERRRLHLRMKEKKALEERWANYSSDRK